MAFPKIIEIRGVKIAIDDWQELQDAIDYFGSASITSPVRNGSEEPLGSTPLPPRRSAPTDMNPGDRVLLQRFVEMGKTGLLVSEVGNILGKQRKAVQPELFKWSVKIGLTSNVDVPAFEQFRHMKGWSFRLTGHYMEVAKELLGD